MKEKEREDKQKRKKVEKEQKLQETRVTLYHVTEKQHAKEIKKNGLKPDRDDRVFFWDSLEQAKKLLSTPAYRGGSIVVARPKDASKLKTAGNHAIVHVGKIKKDEIVKILNGKTREDELIL